MFVINAVATNARLALLHVKSYVKGMAKDSVKHGITLAVTFGESKHGLNLAHVWKCVALRYMHTAEPNTCLFEIPNVRKSVRSDR
jgi:hypothetical protein